MGSHPLAKDNEWFFSQHNIKVVAPIHRQVDRRKKHSSPGVKSGKFVVRGSNECREGVISSMRHQLRKICGTRVSVAGRPAWQKQFRTYGTISLDRALLRQPGESFVSVHSAHITANRSKPNPRYMTKQEQRDWHRQGKYIPWHWRADMKVIRAHRGPRLTQTNVQNFLDICDAVVGPVTVLLNPDRYQGNWWYTGIEDCLNGKTSGDLRWYGVDSSMLEHPSLVSLYAGLVRQCAYMARTDLVDQILSDAEGMHVEDCLNESDEVQALKILKKMQRWVSVPGLKGGGVANVPVQSGTIHKIVSMHKSLYRHGFDATFRGDLAHRWNLQGATGNMTGIHGFMGMQGESVHGKHIARMARKKAA